MEITANKCSGVRGNSIDAVEGIDYNKIFEDVKNDPSLLSTIDVNTLFGSNVGNTIDYLGHKTLEDIGVDILESFDVFENNQNTSILEYFTSVLSGSVNSVLRNSTSSHPLIQQFCHKLIGYRFVDEIYKLHKGKHVRWIRTSVQPSMSLERAGFPLTNGGIVVDIRFLDNGIHILCKNNVGRFIQYRFDECLTYQKLSNDEQLILMLNEQIKR